MTADLARRSPLHRRAGDFAALTGSVRLAEIPYLTMLNLRVRPEEVSRVEAALGAALPAANRTSSSPGWDVLWLGPDEWLLVGAPGAQPGDLPGTVTDVSANRTTIAVSGPSARALLEKACTLDLHPRSFTPGHCAQTTFARALMILWQTTPDGYRLLVRPSFADYVATWLLDAAREFTRPAG